MSTKPTKPLRSKLAIRLGAAFVTSMVVQRGRIQALLREAQHRGAQYLQFSNNEADTDETEE